MLYSMGNQNKYTIIFYGVVSLILVDFPIVFTFFELSDILRK